MSHPGSRPPAHERDRPAPGAPRRPASVREVVTTVFWSFLGIRKGDAMRRDAVTIRPHQVIIVGIIIAAAVVATLIVLVRIITRGA